MKNWKEHKIIYFALILLIGSLSSCVNYLPCRGQDYIIQNITHKELINKFKNFREIHPQYAGNEDYINKDVPHYYIELYWKDLDKYINLDIHLGTEIPNPPTHLNFTNKIAKDSIEYKDINSKELESGHNEKYKKKFETEILDKLGIKWKRENCW